MKTALAMVPSQIRLSLRDIMVDHGISTRGVDPAWVRHLEEAYALEGKTTPLLVTFYGGAYILIGGHHRIEMLRRALGPDGEVLCDLIECPTVKDMQRAAILDNRKNAKPYTEHERVALYKKLREEGWSKKEAREAIGITEEHAQNWDLVRMPATSEPGEKRKPLSTSEPSTSRNPLSPSEPHNQSAPDKLERVELQDKPTFKERVVHDESPGDGERATPIESPNLGERADMKAINFHIQRLRNLLPLAWQKSHDLLWQLEDMMLNELKETPK